MKRRKRRRKAPAALFWAVPAVAVAVIVLSFYLAPRKRKPSTSSPTPNLAVRVDRAKLIQALEAAAAKAGGENAWINLPDREAPPVSDALADAFEVWAAPDACLRVIEASEAEARRNHLTFQFDHISRLGSAGGSHDLCNGRVEVEFRGELLLAFQVREVPRIMRVAIVVDDLGQNYTAAEELSGIHLPITFSVMPHLRYSRETAQTARRTGHEVMLHLPMQPILDSAPDISHDELRVGMGKGEVSKIIRSDLHSVPFVTGVNNHMGSRATGDPRLMSEVMGILAARHLYFIDSRTVDHSVALRAAHQSAVPSFYRSVFLDDTRSIPYTLGQLHTLCHIVQKRGAALAIGHPYPTTIKALIEFLPQLGRQGIQLVPASRLVR